MIEISISQRTEATLSEPPLRLQGFVAHPVHTLVLLLHVWDCTSTRHSGPQAPHTIDLMHVGVVGHNDKPSE